jgi:hypothetical protein
MKRLGSLLMLLGASIGIVAAAGIGGVFHLTFPWIVNLALAKLTLVASGGLMAAGAIVHRIAVRRETASITAGDEARPALAPGSDDED